MAIHGVDPNVAIPYICECERMNTVNATVFYIKPRNTARANEAARRYITARHEGKRGQVEIDDKRATEADIKEFVATVAKVENWIFSTQFPQYRNEDGSDKLHEAITD